MRDKRLFVLIVTIFIPIMWFSESFSLEKETHEAINQEIAKRTIDGFSLNGYLKTNLGFEGGSEEPVYGYSGKKRQYVTQEIWRWLGEGGWMEDEPSDLLTLYANKARNNNHFHNPLQASWENAGLNDYIYLPLPLILPYVGQHCSLSPLFFIGECWYSGQSLVLWAQNTNQNVGDKWSWQDARQYFYTALTATSKTERDIYFAKTFRAVGQQMHLIHDSSIPEHVRNDIHAFKAYEGYVEDIRNEDLSLWGGWISSPITFDKSLLEIISTNPSALVPISRIIDSDLYRSDNPDPDITANPPDSPQYIGLAEYTNANFASPDTIFTEGLASNDRRYFPYPKKSSTNLQELISKNILPETVTAEDGVQESTLFIKKERDGEFIEHFVKPTYTTTSRRDYIGGGTVYALDFYLDEKCYEDYAQKLIPRAVGYSAGLLNYFFRGTLEITAPDSYVYSITDGSINPQQFTKIKAKIMNATPDEEIKNGIIKAVAKYKIIPNYSPDLSNYPPDGDVMKTIDYSYSASESITLTPEEITSINTQPTEFTFDFIGNPIPAGITDLYLHVIFKGTLGNEADIAVAVGMKDLKEPTHHVFWNLTDMFSLLYEKDGVNKYHLHTSDQIKADPDLAKLVDFNNNGIFNEDNESYIDPYPITYEITYMSESPPVNPVYTSASVTNLPPGRYIRLIVLVDDEQMDNYGRLAWLTTLPDRDPEVGDNDFVFDGVTNQEMDGVWQSPTPIITFRTVKQHFYTGILNCYPVAVDPATGVHHCPYPEEEAIPADPTPYPAVISFP
ncbi:MAG: hypothetical protein AB1480_18060 [Nitrospirota bacterium]